jgi:hypothetical protein
VTIYFAHCQANYGTPQEERDMAIIKRIFPDAHIVNPSSEEIAQRCEKVKADWENLENITDPLYRHSLSKFADAGAAKMVLVFWQIATSADLVIYRALPDGRVPAGVAKEVSWAIEHGRPVLELPWGYLPDRTMSVPATKAYLHEVGQR